jgi:hypothetical protein
MSNVSPKAVPLLWNFSPKDRLQSLAGSHPEYCSSLSGLPSGDALAFSLITTPGHFANARADRSSPCSWSLPEFSERTS